VVDKTVIATSIYSGQQWALYLDIPYSRIHIVLPFADPIFGSAKRSKQARKTRIIFAGRLHPDKGIYTVLEMMHEKEMLHYGFVVSVVTAGLHCDTGLTIARMLDGYPYARLIPAQKTVRSMAHLLSQHDILLMLSVYAELFGMLSIEAQHTGCRVVASNIGGLPETNCGLLTLVEPKNPRSLVIGIEQAVALSPATKKEREVAKTNFMLDTSVDSLLKTLHT
jgi:D-inositol-3-phosphate glycosyltransferase